MKRLFTIQEASARYSVCRQTLYAWIKHIGFPEPIRLGGRCFYSEQMLEEWEASQIVSAGRRTKTVFHN